MSKTTIEELENSIRPVMEGFNELKDAVDKKSKATEDALKKFDGFELEMFHKVSKAVDEIIEKQEKITAEQKASAEREKNLETAFNRLADAGIDPEKKAAEVEETCNKHFNVWAKKRNDNKEAFDTYLERAVTDDNEKKALSTLSDPNGGYLVMPQFGGVIQTRIFETSPIRQLASVETVSTDQYEYILDNDEAACGWVGEVSSRSTTNTPTLGKLIIPVNELYANPKTSQKMLDDGIVDVESWLANKVGDIFARTEATAFVSGNGVLKPKGLLSYTAGTTIASQQVQQISTGAATGYTYDGLVNIQNALKEGYQTGAVWLVQRASNANLLTIKDGESRPIFNMQYDKNAGLEPTILGKPVRFAADMPAATTGLLSIIYGDIRQAYKILDRTGIRVLRDPFTDKPNVSFYTTKRVGGAVINFEAYKIGLQD